MQNLEHHSAYLISIYDNQRLINNGTTLRAKLGYLCIRGRHRNMFVKPGSDC